MVKHSKIFTLALIGLLSFSACKKDDPEVPNEEELITTVNYTLTPTDGGSTVTLSFVDIDGEDGGIEPVTTGGTLAANTTYTGALTLLNESEMPTESITAEIAEEDEEHQFFFETDIAGLSVTYNDFDENEFPVGLSSTLTTGNVATGTITITLKHEPEKDETGVADGDMTNAGGETDIQVIFPVNVE